MGLNKAAAVVVSCSAGATQRVHSHYTMAEQPDGLITIQDFVRWGASRFNAAGLYFGHGTDNAIDEAVHLVLAAIDLAPTLPASFRDCRLTPVERVLVSDLIERRVVERVPAAYLTGRAWFAGLEFSVNREVLVPRSPIAELVEAGFEPWVDGEMVTRVLDLCCGSGCIGIAAAVYLPDVDVDLCDISPGAIELTKCNVERHRSVIASGSSSPTSSTRWVRSATT